MMRVARLLLLTAVAYANLAPGAIAQDVNAVASQGEVSLSAGFAPDPHVVMFNAAGADKDASSLSSACGGLIGAAADVHLNYTAAAGVPLIISVASTSDTTLVVSGPNGAWYCDDDGGEEGANPALRFDRPASGRYAIWVGSAAGAQTVDLTFSQATSR